MCKYSQRSIQEFMFISRHKKPIALLLQSNRRLAYATVYLNEPALYTIS
jgi:hypothetical protein